MMLELTKGMVRPLLLAGLLVGVSACSDDGVRPDAEPPSISITSPADGFLGNAGSVTVQGQAADNVGIQRIVYKLNGGADQEVQITRGSTVTFSFSVTLTEGQNAIVVTARDAAGNAGSTTLGVRLDATAPAVTVSSLPASSVVIVNAVPLAGTATDQGGVTRVTYRVGAGAEQDMTIVAGSSVQFSHQLAVPLGSTTVTVSAYDAAGNVTRAERVVDRRQPGAVRVRLRDGMMGPAAEDVSMEVEYAGVVASAQRWLAGSDDVAASPAFVGSLSHAVRHTGGGVYELDLPQNVAVLVRFARQGSITAPYHNARAVADGVEYLPEIHLMPTATAGPGGASGHITSAQTGQGLDSVQVSLRAGLNVTAGAIVANGTTTTSGSFSLSGVAAGYYTAQVSRSGFTTAYFPVFIEGGRVLANQNASITRILGPNQYRIILDWGEQPWDLDSHLTGPEAQSTARFHVAYYSRTYQHGDVLYADLDTDATSGFGPETITLYQTVAGVYRYSVHNYSARSATQGNFGLANSGARVRVYRGEALLRTFHVPTGEEGNLWTVFELENGTIRSVNAMRYSPNDGPLYETTGALEAAPLPSKVVR
jgi:hypothetical protein